MKWFYFGVAVALLATSIYFLIQDNYLEFRLHLIASWVFQLFANIEQLKQNRK